MCVAGRAVEEVELFGSTLPGLEQLFLLKSGEKKSSIEIEGRRHRRKEENMKVNRKIEKI